MEIHPNFCAGGSGLTLGALATVHLARQRAVTEVWDTAGAPGVTNAASRCLTRPAYSRVIPLEGRTAFAVKGTDLDPAPRRDLLASAHLHFFFFFPLQAIRTTEGRLPRFASD